MCPSHPKTDPGSSIQSKGLAHLQGWVGVGRVGWGQGERMLWDAGRSQRSPLGTERSGPGPQRGMGGGGGGMVRLLQTISRELITGPHGVTYND